ncbi:MAG: MFS transporter [bacterium]
MPLQKRVFILSWCAYAGAYLCRTNLSIIIPNLIRDLGWDKAFIGLIGSLFFWSYAFGQLINGYIGDRVNSKIFIFISLFFSSLINITLGSMNNRVLFTILWGMNGFLLSMLWGPIVRTLGLWFSGEDNNKIGIGISTSMFIGYIIYWGPIGRLIKDINWRLVFYIPGVLVLIFSICWIKLLPDRKEDVRGKDLDFTNLSIKSLLTLSILLVGIACLVQGVIKESIGLWTPTLLKETFGESVPSFTLFIPFLGLLGLFSAGWINYKNNNREEISVGLLYLANLIVCSFLFVLLGFNVLLTIALIGVSSALLYGINVLLLANIPLRFARYNSTSTVAGFLDFSSYVGSALASVITGIVSTRFGWQKIILLWGILSAVGILSVYLTQRRNKK